MITKQILPAKAYVNGKQMIAEKLNVISIGDNLFDHVTFKYTLLTDDGVWAGEATFELVGLEQYKTWDASPEGAYQIVANGIGAEFVPSLGAFFE